ncbi:MAG: helix-turn-helix transcriptional regulator [Clostridia bacterium]|nr:helix-turn-helix transcriptional regulator [Clostridia bacterium]
MGDVEKKAGLGFKTIYNWKESAPSADKLLKVANVLNTTMEYLMDETDDIDAVLASSMEIQSASMTFEEKELLSIFQSVSVEGKAAIMTAARAFAGQVDYTKKAASETA